MNFLQRKLYATHRLDGAPFHPHEQTRAAKANSTLPIRGVCCEYRADLPERCQRAGLKTQSGQYGCMCCHELASTVHDKVEHVSLFSVPWKLRTHSSYLDEFFTHLVAVNINDALEKKTIAECVGNVVCVSLGSLCRRHQG